MQPLEKPKPLEIDESAVRNLALRRLSRSAVTEFQLREYLQRKNADEAIIDSVISRFIAANLIDDVAFAEMWVRSRRTTRGTGPAALRRELKLKGIAESIIAAAVEQREGEDFDLACDLAQRKASSLSKLPSDVQFRRLMSFLMRRGHSAAVALSATKTALATMSEKVHEPHY